MDDIYTHIHQPSVVQERSSTFPDLVTFVAGLLFSTLLLLLPTLSSLRRLLSLRSELQWELPVDDGPFTPPGGGKNSARSLMRAKGGGAANSVGGAGKPYSLSSSEL